MGAVAEATYNHDMAVQTSILDSEADGDIAEEVLPDGVRYVLPLRDPPLRWRLFGLGLIVLGLIFVAGAVSLVSVAINSIAATWVSVLLIAIAGLLVIAAIPMVWTGIAEWHGRQFVELLPGRLDVVHCAGPLRWRRRHRMATMQRLIIYDHSRDSEGRQVISGYLASVAFRLEVDKEKDVRRPLVSWYPKPIIQELADRLAERTDLPVMHVGTAPATPAPDTPAPEKPEHSRITEQDQGDQLTILVPAIPLFAWRGGMSVMGIVFSGLGAGAAGLFFYSWLLGGGLSSVFTWVVLLLTIPAVGNWSTLLVERIAQKETYFDIVGDTLLITSRRWREIHQHQWRRNEIERIRCGSSRFKVDDKPASQLEITLHTGDSVTMLTGRDNAELHWLAWRLNNLLHLPDAPQADSGDQHIRSTAPDAERHRQTPAADPA